MCVKYLTVVKLHEESEYARYEFIVLHAYLTQLLLVLHLLFVTQHVCDGYLTMVKVDEESVCVGSSSRFSMLWLSYFYTFFLCDSDLISSILVHRA